MDEDPLIAAAIELYDLPPEQFVAARDEAVKTARSAGDRSLATAIGKLRRPTVGAWAVNRLARHRPELVDELLVIGDRMRSAQRDLRGDEMRELSIRRRVVVDALTRAAVVLARREHRRDNLPIVEIESTLMAALADPEIADQVRSGRLAKTVEYTGFGETPRPQLRLVHGGRTERPVEELGLDLPVREPADEPVKRPATVSHLDVGRNNDVSRNNDAGRNHADSGTRTGQHRPSVKDEVARHASRQRTVDERPTDQHKVDGRRADPRRTDQRRADERGREQREREERDREQRAAEERLAEQTAAAERRAAERAAAAELKRVRAAAHRELLAARTELSEAEAARTTAERAVKAAKRRVEKATTVLNGLDPEDRT